MAALLEKRYDLNYFKARIMDGFICYLDKSTIDIVQKLADQVGAPEYIRTPQFPKREKGDRKDRNRRRKNKGPELSNEAWEAIRNFEVTQIKKSEGINKSIDFVRKSLNKITDKTYAVLRNQIFEQIDNIIEEKASEEDLNKLNISIFDISSKTGFYSKLYATIYSELVNKYDFVGGNINTEIDKFKESYCNIKYTNPDVDYSQFCENNKINAERKSVALFFVNLCEIGMIKKDTIVDIVNEIQRLIINKIEIEDEAGSVDELSELLFIFVVDGKNVINDQEEWETIKRNIVIVSKMQAKKYPSLSNKCVFKHMDILDELE
uniref:MIF4G domain-containing protein n=1 Tax=viral metagenome TaxID=1070528 RepID=A0A6C0JB16_9ZZZZ